MFAYNRANPCFEPLGTELFGLDTWLVTCPMRREYRIWYESETRRRRSDVCCVLIGRSISAIGLLLLLLVQCNRMSDCNRFHCRSFICISLSLSAWVSVCYCKLIFRTFIQLLVFYTAQCRICVEFDIAYINQWPVAPMKGVDYLVCDRWHDIKIILP